LDSLVIDGTTQPGYAGTPLIEINGTNVSSYGLIFNLAGASNSAVRGLVINRFGASGVYITNGATGVVIEGNYIGTDVTGTLDRGNATFGVDIVQSPNNTVRGNLISGNNDAGVVVTGPGANGNIIVGNRIGLNAAGTAALPNANGGILVQAANTTIGGLTAADRNVISGNADSGVRILGAGTTGTTIRGNYIGTNAAGTAAVGNAVDGIVVDGGTGAVIGGIAAGAGNVISGNAGRGIDLTNNSSGTVVRGNLVGTDATGALPLGNGNPGASGIRITGPETRSAGPPPGPATSSPIAGWPASTSTTRPPPAT
jgi:hypothetical protein